VWLHRQYSWLPIFQLSTEADNEAYINPAVGSI
jgi:hypothetical protein